MCVCTVLEGDGVELPPGSCLGYLSSPERSVCACTSCDVVLVLRGI